MKATTSQSYMVFHSSQKKEKQVNDLSQLDRLLRMNTDTPERLVKINLNMLSSMHPSQNIGKICVYSKQDSVCALALARQNKTERLGA